MNRTWVTDESHIGHGLGYKRVTHRSHIVTYGSHMNHRLHYRWIAHGSQNFSSPNLPISDLDTTLTPFGYEKLM